MQEKTLNFVVRTNILKIMKAKNIIPIDVIRKNNYKQATFYRYLDGGRKISLEKLEQISKILDVDCKLLIDRNLVVKTINKIIIQGSDVQSNTKEQIQREEDRSKRSSKSDV